jgi:hypothetical protein
MIAIGKEMYPNLDLRAGDITKEKKSTSTYDAV